MIAFDLVRTEVLDITCRITNSNAAVKTIRELLDTHETDDIKIMATADGYMSQKRR